jgi:hypothetical protein
MLFIVRLKQLSFLIETLQGGTRFPEPIVDSSQRSGIGI